MFTFLKIFRRCSRKKVQCIFQINPQMFLKLLTELLLKLSGGCGIFFILREKGTSCACLLGSRLKVIFHWLHWQIYIIDYAKSLTFVVRLSEKSFIYIKNNHGPRIDPSGTPNSILDYEGSWPFNTTLCFLSFKKSVRVLKRLPDICHFALIWK